MKSKRTNTLEYFKLSPPKPAKISEISEATAASAISPEDKINFHIGNPIEDEELIKLYFNICCLGKASVLDKEEVITALTDEMEETNHLGLIYKAISKSVPYMPRGGYNSRSPHKLIEQFRSWLENDQQEPLEYSIGDKTGSREICLLSGGIYESLRVLFLALSKNFINKPLSLCYKGIDIPDHLKNFEDLFIDDINKENILEYLEKYFSSDKYNPLILLLGKIPTETTRRKLRNYSISHPLFIVEVNNARNHYSLAREAKMKNRVLRLLGPSIIEPKVKNSSLMFAVGNSDFIKALETFHFQIKGTPASAEAELLSYLLEKKYPKSDSEHNNVLSDSRLRNPLEKIALNYTNLAERKVEYFTKKITASSDKLKEITSRTLAGVSAKQGYLSSFYSLSSTDLITSFIEHFDKDWYHEEVEKSFLSEFTRHNPEYDFRESLVISGSARTALSMLGFHCGIEEVISPDFSWTYEHCFPKVSIVPLDNELELDIDNIISLVKEKTAKDLRWSEKGAVILNNPHNATGKVFSESSIKELLKWLLGNNIYVIDDLSYKNVGPSSERLDVPTLREIARDLAANGYINQYQSEKLITVQSLSKTDCFAGARLAIAHIPDKELRKKLKEFNEFIAPNSMALLLAYLFYRNDSINTHTFWNLRNSKFNDRMNALSEAVDILPLSRNPFDIAITRPRGSMYPGMIINKLPDGLSLDWISSELAKEGIGLVPLSTFARTSEGYEIARKTFRLTLGGRDNPENILKKARRVLIDLNYMISEENNNYNKRSPEYNPKPYFKNSSGNYWNLWENISDSIQAEVKNQFDLNLKNIFASGNPEYREKFFDSFLPFRLNNFRQSFQDTFELTEALINDAENNKGNVIINSLSEEFYKDSLSQRKENFKGRLFDRTVHPTQMYSLQVSKTIDELTKSIILGKHPGKKSIAGISNQLINEFLGTNVALKSVEEADELLNELFSLTSVESYMSLNTNNSFNSFLSFWGDWDGSTRPSGQGHRLVAATLVENVTQQCEILKMLKQIKPGLKLEANLSEEIENLNSSNIKFWTLLNNITALTQQLENRFKTLLPYYVAPGKVRQLGIKLRLAKDPLTQMFDHNDRLERKMFELRTERKARLEYYFSLNKRLRKTLFALLPEIKAAIKTPELAVTAGLYKNLLKRFVLTPRIHQKTITARDQFTIDTTVHNIMEINEIAGKYGNPGMILGLQISMSTAPDALISVDRKFQAKAEEILRNSPEVDLPGIWVIPLFEEIGHVTNITGYLSKIWNYAIQNRKVNQLPEERFTDIICEIFIAGSDLSQQVGQTASAELYKQAKYKIMEWLSEKGLVNQVRMKLGSGEPMQRQGGYYSPISGKKAFINTPGNSSLLERNLKDSTRKSTEYATSPLMGIHSSGDLRTFQSNVAEKIKLLSLKDRSELLYHIRELQHIHQRDLIRSTEPLTETRLKYKTKGLQDLERLTTGKKDSSFEEFVKLARENFEQILYGTEEDVTGIHVISYFISRTTPTLRDRPTVRPSKDDTGNKGQKILERISGTIPLKKHGTLLRAIGHNRAQSMMLGYNQLTTGLFRAMKLFCDSYSNDGAHLQILAERVLPHLPVYEILESLRLYHEPQLDYINRIQSSFPAGNSAFIKLREDIDSFTPFIGMLQRELLRRHGLSVAEFFEETYFNTDLLPTLRPDLAVLLQNNLFNTDLSNILNDKENIEKTWSTEVEQLLNKPKQLRYWRKRIWELLLKPISEQVEAFNQLAKALYGLSKDFGSNELKISPLHTDKNLSAILGNQKQGNLDDTMKQFLNAAVQYLSSLPREMSEVPIDIVRSIKDIEKILLIEKQALSKSDQKKLNFYLLQMARIAGENG